MAIYHDRIIVEYDELEGAKMVCDIEAANRPAAYATRCWIFQLPNGNFIYHIGNSNPLGLIAELKATEVYFKMRDGDWLDEGKS